MKRLGMLFVMFALMIGVGFAEIGVPIGYYNTSKDEDIKNLTITAANTIYATTLDAGSIVSIDIQAVGCDIRRVFADDISGSYWTTPNGATYHDHVPVPYGKNKTLWFYSTGTGQVQVMYRYR